MVATVWPFSMDCATCEPINQSLTGTCKSGYTRSGVTVERVQEGKGPSLSSPVTLMPNCSSTWTDPSRVELKYGETHWRGPPLVRCHPATSENAFDNEVKAYC